MRNKAYVIGIIAFIALVGIGGWIFTSQKAAAPTASTQNTAQQNTPANSNSKNSNIDTKNEVAILYTNSGFDKPSYTVKKGQTVRLTNQSTRSLQFSSNDHPTHLLNPELNLETLGAGASTTFQPTKAGNWGVHDHLDPSLTTTLVVTE
jgi:uncharacterized protein HemX